MGCKKGNIPWNKGKHYPLKHDGQFKKGHLLGVRFTSGHVPWNRGKKITFKHGMLGRKHSKEAIEKISKGNLGKKLSEKTKKKIGLAILKNKEINIKKGKIGAEKRWKGHISKPRLPKKGLWTRSFNKNIQLQKKRFRNQRYRVRKRDAFGSHAFEEWILLKEYYGNMCLCCKRTEPEIKLTEDHIMPISKGGTDYIENIQPLCSSCNTRKHAKYISYLPLSNINYLNHGVEGE